ncbi:Mothers against decapentaplegic 7 [Turdus rufiventris]|nr:Mothers against decapentaplegic 7 [Turdus rufiventris]
MERANRAFTYPALTFDTSHLLPMDWKEIRAILPLVSLGHSIHPHLYTCRVRLCRGSRGVGFLVPYGAPCYLQHNNLNIKDASVWKVQLSNFSGIGGQKYGLGTAQTVGNRAGGIVPLCPCAQHWYPLPVLLCKVFRWPDLRHCSEVKRLCCCESYGKAHSELVCCNPHHLSRLCELESPPPPYSRYPMDFLKPTDSQVLQEPGDRSHWCVVAYWEEKTRVGRLYSVQEPSLDIFYDLPQGNGFCLGQLNSDNKSQLVQKVRSKIGYGIQLTKEVDGVWVYNRSSYPIFIKSATLDNPDSRTLLVHKVFPGFSIKAFDYEKAYTLQRPNDHEFTQQPWTGFTVQISFVKGWGQCYTRQFISSCPCWLEVIFNNR